MDDKFYKFQIVLHAIHEDGSNIAYEFKDLTSGQVATYRKTIWTEGLRVETSYQTWEIISPFRIKTAFIFQQDKKYNP